MSDERFAMMSYIHQARSSGARQQKACDVIGISVKTLQRWSQAKNRQDGRIQATHTPQNKLSELERRRVLKIANMSEYASLSPSQIVPKLADKGIYIASESTFYRLLNASKQLKHRNQNKPARKVSRPKMLVATAPNQVYSWDITYLPSQVKGLFFYLYLVLDIYSRKIVGWQIHHEELSVLAADLIVDICHREGVEPGQVALHSDNGSPMKGATMLATLQMLGLFPSFSRPSVSNDNPYSESLFRTLKYRPEYPEKCFSSLSDARVWMKGFEQWYNETHCHSGIRFVTPTQRHNGEDVELLSKRKQLYQQAKAKHPERWSGEIRNWNEVKVVHLNPEKCHSEKREIRAASF